MFETRPTCDPLARTCAGFASNIDVEAITSTEATYALAAVAVGLGATLFMDIWALVMKRIFNVVPPDYCLVGRWLCHMPDGTFTHSDISKAAPVRRECAVGRIAHYAEGTAYSLLLLALVSGRWLMQPTFLPALLFGLATVLVPFLIMQPSFGLGIAASRAPNPMQARLRSLAAHTVFGVGLYVCAVGVRYTLHVHP
jgi:hypothetical protein